MTTQTKEQIQKIYEQIIELTQQGKAMEAFERFYADDVVITEGAQEACFGKDANRKREQEWMDKIVSHNNMELLCVAYGEDLALSEWQVDFEHKDAGHVKGKQVCVTRFQVGKVCDQRFYYNGHKPV